MHSQNKFKEKHVTWIEFLSSSHYILKHKSGNLNNIVNTLSHRHEVLGFKMIKELHLMEVDFKEIWLKCNLETYWQFHCKKSYLFSCNRLCTPRCSLQEVVLLKFQYGGMVGYFKQDKTLALVK